jgi:hypothetical protein
MWENATTIRNVPEVASLYRNKWPYVYLYSISLQVVPLGSDIETFVRLLEAFLEAICRYLRQCYRRFCSDFLESAYRRHFRIYFNGGNWKNSGDDKSWVDRGCSKAVVFCIMNFLYRSLRMPWTLPTDVPWVLFRVGHFSQVCAHAQCFRHLWKLAVSWSADRRHWHSHGRHETACGTRKRAFHHWRLAIPGGSKHP